MARKTTRGKSASKFKGLWKKARETTADDTSDFGDAVPVDAGNYIAQLIGCDFDDGNNGRQIRLKWEILDNDEFGGAKVTTWEGIEDDERLVWLQRLLVKLGVDVDEVEPDSESDLEEIFKDLIEENTVVKATVKAKDDFKNFYVKKFIEDYDGELAGGSDDKEDEDDDEGPDFDAMSRKELKAYIKSEELDIKVTKKMSDEDIIEAIEAELEEED